MTKEAKEWEKAQNLFPADERGSAPEVSETGCVQCPSIEAWRGTSLWFATAFVGGKQFAGHGRSRAEAIGMAVEATLAAGFRLSFYEMPGPIRPEGEDEMRRDSEATGRQRDEGESISRDGRRFINEAYPDEWESVLEAKGDYDRASAVWLSKLAATVRTADGELFKRGCWEFYSVHFPHRQMPHLETLHSALPQLEIEDGEVCVRWRGNDQERRFKISELYQDKKAAQRAVLADIDEYLGWCKADRDKLAAEVGS